MKPDRRRYTRYASRNESYAMTGGGSSQFGKIVDISLNGMAFDYLDDAATPAREANTISFFSLHHDFHLHELSCRVVYDRPIMTPNEIDDGLIQKNRCGVQFISLTGRQQDQLNQFIEKYTTEQVSQPIE